MPRLVRVARYVIVNSVVSSTMLPRRLRWRVLRLLGHRVEQSLIMPDVFVGGGSVTIGEGSFVNFRCFLDTSAPVTIGRDVALGMGTTLATSSHHLGASQRRAGKTSVASVSIGDGCWLGANVTVLPGVTIGPGAVVAAGAVVVEDCKPDTLYAGVPAREVRSLS